MEFDGAAAAMHIDVSADVWQIDFTARLAGMDEARRLLAFDHYGEAAFLGMVFRSAIRTVPLLLPPAWVMWEVCASVCANLTACRLRSGIPSGLMQAGRDLLPANGIPFYVLRPPEHASYTDGNGFRHFVAPLAKLTSEGLQDLRPQTPDEEQSNALAEHENPADIRMPH